MIKSLAMAALMSGLLAGAAQAQTVAQTATPAPTAPSTTPAVVPAQPTAPMQAQVPTPAPAAVPAATTQAGGGAPDSPDQCLKAASDLAQSAEDRKLAEAQLDKIEDLLTKMETHCDARQYVEAMAVANDIKSLIETR